LRGTQVLPFSPNVIAGYSAGTFGGGSNLVAQPGGFLGFMEQRFGNFAGRQDFDIVLYWTAQNMGIGNVALIRAARARLGMSQFEQSIELNRVRMQVATSYAGTHVRFAEIDTGRQAVESGIRAWNEDILRIRGGAGLPIAALDSLRLLGNSRYAYIDAIAAYNRSQFELYVALGQPPAQMLARAFPAPPVPQLNQGGGQAGGANNPQGGRP
jgi:outer membrane protein TolC